MRSPLVLVCEHTLRVSIGLDAGGRLRSRGHLLLDARLESNSARTLSAGEKPIPHARFAQHSPACFVYCVASCNSLARLGHSWRAFICARTGLLGFAVKCCNPHNMLHRLDTRIVTSPTPALFCPETAGVGGDPAAPGVGGGPAARPSGGGDPRADGRRVRDGDQQGARQGVRCVRAHQRSHTCSHIHADSHAPTCVQTHARECRYTLLLCVCHS